MNTNHEALIENARAAIYADANRLAHATEIDTAADAYESARRDISIFNGYQRALGRPEFTYSEFGDAVRTFNFYIDNGLS